MKDRNSLLFIPESKRPPKAQELATRVWSTESIGLRTSEDAEPSQDAPHVIIFGDRGDVFVDKVAAACSLRKSCHVVDRFDRMAYSLHMESDGHVSGSLSFDGHTLAVEDVCGAWLHWSAYKRLIPESGGFEEHETFAAALALFDAFGTRLVNRPSSRGFLMPHWHEVAARAGMVVPPVRCSTAGSDDGTQQTDAVASELIVVGRSVLNAKTGAAYEDVTTANAIIRSLIGSGIQLASLRIAHRPGWPTMLCSLNVWYHLMSFPDLADEISTRLAELLCGYHRR